jgi:HEAT repeat protein
MPPALNNASPQKLVAQASSPDEVTRYYAASLMGNAADDATRKALVFLLDDPSPLVCKSALVALARRSGLTDQKLIDALGARLEKPRDAVAGALRSFVADLLGHIGEPAVPRLLAVLQSGQNQAAPYAYRALGETGTANAQAVAALMQRLQKPVGADPNQEIAIKALGDLKARAAVPALLSILNDNVRDHEYIRQQAVIALGRIGDPAAVGPLIAEFNKTYSTVVVYVIPESLDTALRALTGQQGLVGKDDWQRWWSRHGNKAG